MVWPKIYLIGRKLVRICFHKLTSLLKPRKLKELERYETSPRIIEYPFIFENVSKLSQGKVLDVGCFGSFLVTELAALGFEMYGIDFRLYKVKYPDVTLVRGNICKVPYRDACFDAVIAVSTVEHIGIKEPYGDLYDPKGDQKAMKEMIRILKPDGRLLVTVPYGIRTQKWYRSYKDASLRELISGLRVNIIKYFAIKDGYWIPVSKIDAEKSRAIVLLALMRA